MLRVLNKYEVNYSQCTECASLQSAPPFWLNEAYESNLALLDTGSAQRNLANLAVVYGVSRALAARNILDFGGGDGLLCRLLRDYGLNCYVSDKYAAISYARGFTVPDFQVPDLLLVLEILEHFENPGTDIDALFCSNPHAILASTGIYSDQGPDWWYLTPETGQHVFFYSQRALVSIGRSRGYDVHVRSNYVLFLKMAHHPPHRRLLARASLNKVWTRLLAAALRMMPAKGVWSDFEAIQGRLREPKSVRRDDR